MLTSVMSHTRSKQITVFIPSAPKDFCKLPQCIGGLRHIRESIHRIVIVSPCDPRTEVRLPENAGFCDESMFPFSLTEVRDLLKRRSLHANNATWYFQQLLKLYAFRSPFSENSHYILVHDADVAFARPVRFFDDNGQGLLSYGYPLLWTRQAADAARAYSHVEAEFARTLVPGLPLTTTFSGMHHHQLYERNILESMLAEVEHRTHQPFWRALLLNISPQRQQAASEYLLYFHYARARFPHQIRARHLKSCDIVFAATESDPPLRPWKNAIASGLYDLVGCHGFADFRHCLFENDYVGADIRAEIRSAGATAYSLFLEGDASICIRSVLSQLQVMPGAWRGI